MTATAPPPGVAVRNGLEPGPASAPSPGGRDGELSVHLHRAVVREELEVHFLPIVSLAAGEVLGVEALARWRHRGRLLETGEFLALAERTGQIVEIGTWVIAEAARRVATWNAAHPGRRSLGLALNVSARELVRPGGASEIERILADADLDPSLVCLEVREDTLQQLGTTIGPALAPLRQLGMRLSVDDFGTGATPIATLIDDRIDELKVDRRFVSRMDVDDDAAAVVRGIVRLAQSLRMHTVAEGVERPAQGQMLRALGCDAAQGWFFARPGADIDEVVRLAEASVAGTASPTSEPGPMWDTMPSARAAAHFVEAVFQTSPIGMALIDAEGRHLATNPALSEVLGHPANALAGSTCWETVHPADLHDDLSAMDALLRGERASYTIDERVVDETGALRWVQVTVTGVPSEQQAEGLPTVLLRQVQSIEARRRSTAEAALLRSIIEASPDPVMTTDGRGRCTRWNPAAEELFGWSRDEAVGSPLGQLVPPGEQPVLARAIARATNGEAVRWSDATWMAADGSHRPVDVTLGPVAGGDDDEVGLVVLARDVAEQRDAARSLRGANEALEARAAELAEANARLADLASTLTHDLMQPVSTMSGFLSLLERGATELEDEHRTWLEGASRGRDRIVLAIEALYRHATAEEVALVPVDLDEVVAELLQDLAADGNGMIVHREQLPVISGDPGLVAQVLANLLQNAARYRHPDRELEITLRIAREPRAWVLAVCDNGQGIAPEDAERVFEPGVRGCAAAGTTGSGIGLATVRSLMQRIGGAAWVEPTDLAGAQICLRFRAVERAPARSGDDVLDTA